MKIRHLMNPLSIPSILKNVKIRTFGFKILSIPQVSILQESVLGQFDSDETLANPLGRKALPVQVVLAAVQPERQPQQAHEGPRRLSDVTKYYLFHDGPWNIATVLSNTGHSTRYEHTTKTVEIHFQRRHREYLRRRLEGPRVNSGGYGRWIFGEKSSRVLVFSRKTKKVKKTKRKRNKQKERCENYSALRYYFIQMKSAPEMFTFYWEKIMLLRRLLRI